MRGTCHHRRLFVGPPVVAVATSLCMHASMSLIGVGCGEEEVPPDTDVIADVDATDSAADTAPVTDGDTSDSLAPETGDTGDPFEALAAVVEAERKELLVAGVAVAVVKDGEIVWSQGFGVKHTDREDPILPTTRFRIGSVTKPLTALGMLRLVEQGKVDLDAPVVQYIPELRLTQSAEWLPSLTVRHLLMHASGLASSDAFGATYPAEALDEALDKVLTSDAFAQEHHLMFPPGRMFFYSNLGYDLAGLVIERVSGRSYVDYMNEEVFAPLGMERATFRDDAVEADGDYAFGAGWESPFWKAPAWQRPCGLAFASVLDLARFARFLTDGDPAVLSAALHDEMVAPQISTGWYLERQHVGLGVWLARGVALPSFGRADECGGDGHCVYDHDFDSYVLSGVMGSTTTFALIVPAHRFAIVIIASAQATTFLDSTRAALELVLGLPELPLVVAHEDPAAFGRYAGIYDADTGQSTGAGEVTVRLVGGGLEMTFPPDDDSCRLEPQTSGNFRCPGYDNYSPVTFISDEAGNVEYLRTMGMGWTARRR